MKIALKYFWSLAIIPFLVFLKGDLSLDTYMNINHIQSFSETQTLVKENLKADLPNQFIVSVKPISKNSSFSAEGLLVNLYSETYDLIGQSQVIDGKVKFEIDNTADSTQTYHIVVPKTADELILNVNETTKLLIYEEHLND